MKKHIILYIVCCYALPTYFVLEEFINALPGIGLVIILVIVMALAIYNIVKAIISSNRLIINNDYFKSLLVFKLIMVPFFILNFFMWYIETSLVFLFGGFLFIPIGIAFTYLILLSSSAYFIAGLNVLYKNKKITADFLVIHLILQLFFVIDVFDYIYAYHTLKNMDFDNK